MHRLAFAIAGCVLAVAASASEPEQRTPSGLVGLLTPPPALSSDLLMQGGPVYSDPACTQADWKVIYPLVAQPKAASVEIGELRFGPRQLGENRSCELVQPWITPKDGDPLPLLPVLESGYEEVAAPVLERRGDWYRIPTPGGSAWLSAAGRGLRFDAYPDLLVDRLAYVLPEWDGQLCADIGEDCRSIVVMDEAPLDVLAIRVVDGEAWLQVEFTNDGCDGSASAVLHSGWIRAYGKGGHVSAWFHSRGC